MGVADSEMRGCEVDHCAKRSLSFNAVTTDRGQCKFFADSLIFKGEANKEVWIKRHTRERPNSDKGK